jgi:DNA polymerase (family 10)
MVDKDEVAERISEYGELLEEQGIKYKPRSYYRAAENIRSYDGSLRELAIQGAAEKFQEIDGVGPPIARHMAEYVIDN